MAAYFKRENNLFMLLGAVLAVLLTVPFYRNWLPAQEFYIKAFYLALPAFGGVAVGRIFSGWWANRKIRRMEEILYEQNDPERFIREFSPLVERVPRQTIEYVSGRAKLAYAFEALGNFEESLILMEELRPEELRLHSLAACALLANQRARVYLLLEDTKKAEEQINCLREIREEAVRRAPTLAARIADCIRLAEVWLGFLKGESCETGYIEEEIQLAKNEIHKEEMKALLERMKKTSP